MGPLNIIRFAGKQNRRKERTMLETLPKQVCLKIILSFILREVLTRIRNGQSLLPMDIGWRKQSSIGVMRQLRNKTSCLRSKLKEAEREFLERLIVFRRSNLIFSAF